MGRAISREDEEWYNRGISFEELGGGSEVVVGLKNSVEKRGQL